MISMAGRWDRVAAGVVCITLTALLACMANATPPNALLSKFQETIAKVRTSERSMARTNAAEHLSELARKIDPSEVDDKTLADLIALLDTWDDSVRVPVAISLGNLGTRARGAAPQLLKILPEVDCLWVDVPPAPIIRDALTRMGVTPPPLPICDTKVDPVVWNQQIRQTISKVRAGESSVARAKAAMHLAYLTHFIDGREIDDKTIADLVSLLDIPDEPVREGVAGSLGNLGRRARVAAPRHEKLFQEVKLC